MEREGPPTGPQGRLRRRRPHDPSLSDRLVGGAVDLHSHTTASDGSLAPRELVRLAVKHGVRVLAITDHDSTDALAEAMDEARHHPPLQIVPGLEINCDVPGRGNGGPAEIPVLGYSLDWEAAGVPQFLREQRAGLMGIETYYPEHSTAQTATYLELCRRHDLVATGGSDYHGPHLGKAAHPGTPAIPLAVWEALRARAAQARGGSAS